MKFPKIDGPSIKNFLLYNVEKVIFGISFILLALFFWLGFNAEKYDESPDSLVSESEKASSFITKASNWELIEEYRKGDTGIPERIANASEPVDSSNYKIAGLSMIPKMLQLRTDPPLPVVGEMEAHVIRATVAVKQENQTELDQLLQLPVAKRQVDPDEEENSMSSMMEMQMMQNEQMEMDMASMMGMDMEGPGARKKKKKKKKDKNKDPQETAEVDAWSGVPGVQEAVAGALRPGRIGISPSNTMALKRNVVVVNGLVEHRKLWKEQEQVLSNSVAWYPKRDLPRYEFLQVEKRTIGADGKPTEWKDVSEWINFDQAELNPGSFVSGPEVVGPWNFDRNLTNAIPAMLGVDYRDFVLHSKLQPRVFKKVEKEEKTSDALNALSGIKSKEDEEGAYDSRFNRGGRRQKGTLVQGGSMGMMMDMGPGADMMGAGMMDPGMMMGSMFGMRGDGRSSSDMTEYAKLTDPTMEPESDYKAVRFFDMRVAPVKTTKYEYRVRLWLADPNTTDPEATRGGMAEIPDMSDMDPMMMGGMGRGKDKEKPLVKTDINFTMQDQQVRDRLKLAREEEDENGDPIFFVSEFYDGQDMPTEVMVPKGFEYLRFARPTKWSEPVSVTVGGTEPKFYAESVDPPRTVGIGDTEVPIEEPKVAMIAEIENPDLGKGRFDMAGKKEFSIGDLMNFAEPVTILHPVAMSVHFLEKGDFKTESTLIDVMGGDRLGLPRNDPTQYSLPGESLVMRPDGQFIVTNDIEQRTEARHALRLPDEKAEYGKRKKKVDAMSPFGMGGPMMDAMGPTGR